MPITADIQHYSFHLKKQAAQTRLKITAEQTSDRRCCRALGLSTDESNPLHAIPQNHHRSIQRHGHLQTARRRDSSTAHWYGIELPMAANERSQAHFFIDCAYPPLARQSRKSPSS
ncbi:hypothetical protein [Bradyrhizobium neotropicale]|uniref:hypothetical protein n=1 Tax=Bradyrhizobium neotropicale TaxID=1497615 RepID=UPI0011AB66EC|nr:hypothetical protein [Bradyrhizobium neotropicale]